MILGASFALGCAHTTIASRSNQHRSLQQNHEIRGFVYKASRFIPIQDVIGLSELDSLSSKGFEFNSISDHGISLAHAEGRLAGRVGRTISHNMQQ